jgi:hypothetical protein
LTASKGINPAITLAAGTKRSNSGLSRITRLKNLESHLGGRYSRPLLWSTSGFSRSQQQITRVGYYGPRKMIMESLNLLSQ